MKMLFFDLRDSEEQYFKENEHPDYDIKFYKNSLNESTELSQEEMENTSVISVFINSVITEKVINKFKNLFIISTRSTGYNHIDLQACENRNIAVLNVENYGKESVVQYTLGVIISIVRNIIPGVIGFKEGDIDFEKLTGRNLSALTIGVIGTGAIGSELCKIMHQFGMKILAYDVKVSPELSNFVDYVTLDDLYKESDIITLHIPYSDELYHMVSDYEFDMMKDGVYIINTSRGELIDTVALYKAVQNKKVIGAALDVLECEELSISKGNLINTIQESSCTCLNNTIVNQQLMKEENVIITPHIAYNTKESVDFILHKTFYNINDYWKGNKSNRVV